MAMNGALRGRVQHAVRESEAAGVPLAAIVNIIIGGFIVAAMAALAVLGGLL